jgi:hypothetical protein
MLCLVSQLTDQACIHTINPFGISPEQKKQIYLTLNGVVEMKDGSIKWK